MPMSGSITPSVVRGAGAGLAEMLTTQSGGAALRIGRRRARRFDPGL